jgi:hypothetical protein
MQLLQSCCKYGAIPFCLFGRDARQFVAVWVNLSAGNLIGKLNKSNVRLSLSKAKALKDDKMTVLVRP